MHKVKVKQVFKFKGGKQFKKDEVVELTEKEVKAVQNQLGDDFLEVIQEIEDNDINFDAMNVPDLENWLEENNVEFDAKAKKSEKVKLANEKLAELNEQEENEKE